MREKEGSGEQEGDGSQQLAAMLCLLCGSARTAGAPSTS